jgi:hypothetical protein
VVEPCRVGPGTWRGLANRRFQAAGPAGCGPGGRAGAGGLRVREAAARGGGVSRPWRGAWNTPCRKHHVTVTPQKSRAPGNKGQLCGRLAWGLAPTARVAQPAPPRPAPHPHTPGYLPRPRNLAGQGGAGGLRELGREDTEDAVKSKCGAGSRLGCSAFTVAFVIAGSGRLRAPSRNFLLCNRWGDNCPA